MAPVLDIEASFKILDKFLSYSEQLISDLSHNTGMSSYGKEVLMEQLSKCISDCRRVFKTSVQAGVSLKSKYKELENKISEPQNLEQEFKDIAKKLNFPITQATTEGISSKNPNIEVPFEDPVPKKDVEFMQKCLKKTDGIDVNDIVLPKDECLTKKEIAAYTDIDKAFAEDRKTAKKISSSLKKAKNKKKPVAKKVKIS